MWICRNITNKQAQRRRLQLVVEKWDVGFDIVCLLSFSTPPSRSLPPSASLCDAAKVNTAFSALNHRISQRKRGCALAERWWPGLGSGRGSRTLPQKRSVIAAPTGSSRLSEHVLAYWSAPTWHKYLHDTGWHGRSHHKSYKLITAHYRQHSEWPPGQTVAK